MWSDVAFVSRAHASPTFTHCAVNSALVTLIFIIVARTVYTDGHITKLKYTIAHSVDMLIHIGIHLCLP